jgi:hypothetical protein
MSQVYLVFQATESLLKQDHKAKLRPLPSKAYYDVGLLENVIYNIEFDMYFGNIVERYTLASNEANKELALMPRKNMREWLLKNINYGDFYFVKPEIMDGKLISLRILSQKEVAFRIEITLLNSSNLKLHTFFHGEQSYFGIIS